MRARVLLAGLLLVSAADAGEVSLLKGAPIKGDIVSVSDKEVVINDGAANQKVPIANVLKVDYADVGVPPADAKYSLAELTDGSILKVSTYSIKKKQVELGLLVGAKVSLPLNCVSNILSPGEVASHRADWANRVLNTKGREAIVVNREGVISNISCTFGQGSDDGTTLDAAVTIGMKALVTRRKLGRVEGADHGFIFKYTLDPKAPLPTCRLYDTYGDLVVVSEVSTTKAGGLEVTTPAGVKLEFTRAQLARLDYAPGKLDYLSDLVPVRVVAHSNLDEEAKPDQWHVYKDTNLNKGKITLGGTVYNKGLALKPYAELSYNLRGNYRALSLVVGVDDKVKSSGASVLLIEGDGKEMAQIKIDSADKVRFKDVKLNIKDVRELKIIVKSGGLFDISRHLDLADIKVSK